MCARTSGTGSRSREEIPTASSASARCSAADPTSGMDAIRAPIASSRAVGSRCGAREPWPRSSGAAVGLGVVAEHGDLLSQQPRPGRVADRGAALVKGHPGQAGDDLLGGGVADPAHRQGGVGDEVGATGGVGVGSGLLGRGHRIRVPTGAVPRPGGGEGGLREPRGRRPAAVGRQDRLRLESGGVLVRPQPRRLVGRPLPPRRRLVAGHRVRTGGVPVRGHAHRWYAGPSPPAARPAGGGRPATAQGEPAAQ